MIIIIIGVIFFVVMSFILGAVIFVETYKQFLRYKQIRATQQYDKQKKEERIKKELENINTTCDAHKNKKHNNTCIECNITCACSTCKNNKQNLTTNKN